MAKQLPPKVSAFLSRYFLQLELVLVIIAMAGLYMTHYGVDSAGAVFSAGLSLLATLYFLNAFAVTEASDIFIIVIFKVLHIGWSVCIIALMFRYLQLEGAGSMLSMGTIVCIIGTAILFFLGLKKWRRDYSIVMARSCLIIAISTYLLMS